MKKITILLFTVFCATLFAQTSINEKFNNVNGKLPKDWEAVFDAGLNYNTAYTYGIDYNTNYNDRALGFQQQGNPKTKISGWVLTSKMSVTEGVEYEYSFHVQLNKNNNVKYVFAYGDANETFAMTNILEDYSSTAFTNASDKVWVKFEGTFTPKKTEDIYFGFKGFTKEDTNEVNLTVDNLLIRKIPECSPVTSLVLTSATETTAEVSWKHTVAGGFNVKVFEKDAVFDTATPVFEKTVTDKTAIITGLQVAKAYDVYVQGNCDTKGVSDWSPKFTITTKCKPEYETFSEDFGYSSNLEKADIPLCWSKIVTPKNDKNLIKVSYGTLTIGGTVKERETNILITPKLSTLKANTNYRLRIDSYMGSCKDTNENDCTTNKLNFIEIGTMSAPNDASTYTPFKKIKGYGYGTVSVDFSNYTGTDSYIAIKRPADNNKNYSININSLHWEKIPATKPVPQCTYLEYPSGTVNFKDISFISWAPSNEADSYILKIGTTEDGEDIVAETTVNDIYYPLSSSKLDYGKQYYITLIPKNSAGEAPKCTTLTFNTSPNKNFGGGDENTKYGGYYYSNSTPDAKESSIKPTYNWIDPIANKHTKIVETDWKQSSRKRKGDGYYPIANLQFDFPYYGKDYGNGDVYLNRNGAIHFDKNFDSTDQTKNIGGASTGTFKLRNTIMGYLTSFRPDKTDIYYHATEDKLIVTWYKAYNGMLYYVNEIGVDANGKEYVTFQIILNKNGDIKVQINSDLSSIDTEKLGGNFSHYSLTAAKLIGITNDAGPYDTNRKEVMYTPVSDTSVPLFDNSTTSPSSLAVIFTKSKPSLSNKLYTTNDNSIHVYPNPVKNVLNMKTINTIKEVTLYTILGKKLLVAKNTNNLNVSNLPQGVYVLKALTEKGTETFKIIKQ